MAAVYALCFFLGLLIYRRYLSPLSTIPGPALASVTRLWHMYYIWTGQQADRIIALHDELGPFVRIAPNEISIAHAEGPKKLLLTPQRKGDWYSALRFPDWRFRTPMALTDPAEKTDMSRLVNPAYAASAVLKAEEAMNATVAVLLDWMDGYAQRGEAMDLARFLTFTAFDLVGEVVFSRPFGYLQAGHDIAHSLQQAQAFSGYATILPYFRRLHNALVGNPLVTWLDVLPTSFIIKTSLRALAARRANPDARFDMVAHWLRAHERQPARLTARDVEAVVTSTGVAGADTVSCALQSFVYHMARHPSAWQTARDELLQTYPNTGADRVVSYADSVKLPYLQACIKEALRIFTPVPMGLPRVAPREGIRIGERWFAAGTTLSVFPPGLHLSRRIWGKDAREFRPERWLEDDAARLDGYFIPWGLGYNACPGQKLARIELSKITATLVRDYHIRLVEPSKEWRYKTYFTVVPEGWPVHVEKTTRTNM